MMPLWMDQLVHHAPGATLASMTSLHPETTTARQAAVLILVGPSGNHGEVILIQRAQGDDPHSGQMAFPGGQVEPHDKDAVATALREAREEIGLNPDSVSVITKLPQLWLPPSGFLVTPVLGWWHQSHDLQVGDESEVRSIHRVSLQHLIKPEHRFQVQAGNGFIGPAFSFESMTIWGFTGALLSEVVDLGGWAKPWDTTLIRNLDQI